MRTILLFIAALSAAFTVNRGVKEWHRAERAAVISSATVVASLGPIVTPRPKSAIVPPVRRVKPKGGEHRRKIAAR